MFVFIFDFDMLRLDYANTIICRYCSAGHNSLNLDWRPFLLLCLNFCLRLQPHVTLHSNIVMAIIIHIHIAVWPQQQTKQFKPHSQNYFNVI